MGTTAPSSRTISNVLIIGTPLSDENRKRIETEGGLTITHVRSRDTPIPDEQLAEADVIFGLPVKWAKSVKQVPRLQFIQLHSAGAEVILGSDLLKEEESKRIVIASAAGTHTSSIPEVSILPRCHKTLDH